MEKQCKKHGVLHTNDIGCNNKCLICSREYARLKRKQDPEKYKAIRQRYNDKKKKIIEELGEYKPKKQLKRRKEIPTFKICKHHGLLDSKDVFLREGKYLRCKLCAYARNRSWEKRNPEKVKRNKALTYLRHCARYSEESIARQHQITVNEYRKLIESQNNLCAICGKQESRIARKDRSVSPLSIDHCHKTGKIRGLLCGKCNMALGGFEDSIEMMQNAITYLRVHNDASSKINTTN